MSADVEVAKAALVNHLASCSTWDNESEELTEKFTMAMLKEGFSETSAIQELFSAGISKRDAKQVVLSVCKKLGIAPKPNLAVRITSRATSRVVESRVSRKIYSFAVRYRYIILVLVIAGIGLICYDAIRYKMTEEEQEFYREIQNKLDANAYLNIAWLNEAVSKNYLAVTKYLIKKGADVNGTNNRGFAPLHYVESAKITKILLKKGANPKIKSNDGSTPLHMYINDPSIVRLLIRAGADVNAKDNEGQTPLDDCGYTELQKAEVLLQNNARVGTGQGSFLIRIFAKDNKYYNCLSSLLKAGANPNGGADEIRSIKPLHLAVVANSVSNVDVLLKHGADINAKVPSGYFAGKALNVIMAKYEMSESHLRGGDEYKNHVLKNRDLTMIEGMTALEIAEKLKFHEIARILRNRGAR